MTRLKLVGLVLVLSLWSVAVFGIAKAPPVVPQFPTGFKWCVSTAAHQIEGQNVNSDWWDWEQVPGHIKNGERSGAACDHWNRLETDVALLKSLNVSTYRFSVEWARIEPVQGQWNWDAVQHYKRELALLAANGIEPMITLQHFTLPRWVRQQGGWTWDQAPALFARYAVFVQANIGPGVRDWLTINEPVVSVFEGYLAGVHPPGLKGKMPDAVPPMLGMLKAHAAAYHAMHSAAAKTSAPIRVGVAHHLRIFDPPSFCSLLDAFVAGQLDGAFNWAWADTLRTGRFKLDVIGTVHSDIAVPEAADTQDFIGVNYYTRDTVHASLNGSYTLGVPAKAAVTDLGWEIYPDGFYRVLKAASQHFPGKPIFITENGLADSRDSQRITFLEQHLAEVSRAINDKIPVEGYCHWSLMDNFEWADGFGPRFGLFEVNYNTQARTARPSAIRFSEIARLNHL